MESDLKIRKLNTLRGIASLMVIFSHYSNETGFLGGNLGQGAGQFGVMLFFMLSAFLIGHLYFDRTPNSKHVKDYIIARCARIAPLFLLVVISSFTYIYFLKSPFGDISFNIPDYQSALDHIFLFRGDAVLWSIQPEIYFYIFFLAAWIFKPKINSYVLLLTAFLSLLSFIFISTPKFTTVSIFEYQYQTSFLRTFPYFSSGLLVAYLFSRWETPKKYSNHYFALSLLIIPFLFPNIFKYFAGYSHKLWGDPFVFIIMTLIFFVVIFLVPRENAFLENKLGDFFGSISFSIYLLHYPIIKVLKSIEMLNGLTGAILFFGLTILFSHLCYVYYEHPMRNWIRSLGNSSTT